MHIYIDFHNHTGRHIYVYIITDLLSSNIWFRLLCNKSSFDSAYTKGKFYLTPSIGDKHDDIKANSTDLECVFMSSSSKMLGVRRSFSRLYRHSKEKTLTYN